MPLERGTFSLLNLHCQAPDSPRTMEPKLRILVRQDLPRQRAALGRQVAANPPMTDELHSFLRWYWRPVKPPSNKRAPTGRQKGSPQGNCLNVWGMFPFFWDFASNRARLQAFVSGTRTPRGNRRQTRDGNRSQIRRTHEKQVQSDKKVRQPRGWETATSKASHSSKKRGTVVEERGCAIPTDEGARGDKEGPTDVSHGRWPPF
jgi:hypothetical protein